jgi:hypothetical protein
MTTVDEIPVAYTPTGGWHDDMPAPILAGCTTPLVDGAPDLRGLWEVVQVSVNGVDDPAHRSLGRRQRIEQAGDRLIVTSSGVIHDMRCDGTVEHGVHDVMQSDFTTPIVVVATYEDGVHVLRPEGVPDGITVTRQLDGDQLVWGYAGMFVARCTRV